MRSKNRKGKCLEVTPIAQGFGAQWSRDEGGTDARFQCFALSWGND